MDRMEEGLFLLSLLVLILIVQLPLLQAWPFVTDENIYSIMIWEQIQHKTLKPTLLGYETLWKPPLFFWTYAVLVDALRHVDMPLESLFRLPTIFFGILSVYALYFLLKELKIEDTSCCLMVVLYSLLPIVMYTSNNVMMDTMTNFFVLMSLLFYLKRDWPDYRFLIAGLFVVFAFFTKFLVAVIGPLLAVGYFYLEDKKILRKPLFLLSFFAIPVSIIIHYFLVMDSSIFIELYTTDIIGHLTSNSNTDGLLLQRAWGALTAAFISLGLWLFLSLAGVYYFWKRNKFFTLWYLVLLIPLISAYLKPWYFLPVAIPIAYFSMRILANVNKEKFEIDKFAIFGFLIFLLVSVIITQMFFWNLHNSYIENKKVGEIISGKDNVLIVGSYKNGIVAYKILNEEMEFGESKDFGWVVIPSELNQTIDRFIEDYRYGNNINEEDINRVYWRTDQIFRKKTNITNFDYAVITFEYENASKWGDVLYNTSDIWVIKLKNNLSR